MVEQSDVRRVIHHPLH